MSKPGLLAWQWEGYAQYHKARGNLLLHIWLVPLFLAGNVWLVEGAFRLDWMEAALGAGCMIFSIVIQGQAHKNEAVPPVPFSSPGNAIARIFLEQWITFPRFLMSGGWWRAFAASKPDV